MGCGKNGTFDKVPDLTQWAILTQHRNGKLNQTSLQHLYGMWIARWIKWFALETLTFQLEPIGGHGTWDGKQVFGQISTTQHEGPIATLTRATIRISKMKYFWQNVAPVAANMLTAPGFEFSVGIGEIPWIKQATFSIWTTETHMKNFAYGMKTHSEVIKKTRKEKWYSEDMFVRFKILHTEGQLRNYPPVKRNPYF